MHRIPLACADFSFPLLPHEQTLSLIAGMGIEGVDISLMFQRSHLDVEAVLANPRPAARELSSRLADRGLAIADINFTPGPDFRTRAVNHPDPAERRSSAEMFRKAVEFAVLSNAVHMTILPGVHWESEDYESSLARCAEELRWRVEEASRVGVIVSVEAHLGSIVPTPAQAVRLLDLVSGLTLTLDYTHFTYQGFTDPDCEALLPRASHFHARGGRRGRLQAPLKESSIDYRRVLEKMKEVDYRGYFAIEYVWIDWEHCNETDNVSETILMRDLANQFR
ncbi:MAG: sugar phosphate isomerase/epimerase [Acidobacteria bacterium]|nr:sugar phosphate isomerase/epimerase [Acidobacteriota bacterium]